MTAPAVLVNEEALVSRRELTSSRGPDTSARRIVGDAASTFELVVDSAERGRTVDGWLSVDGLVWHVRGDEDTPRTAIVTSPAYLASVVARMVDLGPRPTPERDDVVVAADALRAQLAGAGTGLPGGLVRVWNLSWTGSSAGALTVVDQGRTGGLWAIVEVLDGDVRLRPVRPLDVWQQLAGIPTAALLSAPSSGRGPGPAAVPR